MNKKNNTPYASTTKIQTNKLAPGIIGGIIQSIEEYPIKNTNWIESISIDNNNTWTVTIKPKAPYYPYSIHKYNQSTKSLILKGKLFEIEQILLKYLNK